MVKHTKAIGRLLPMNCLSVFDHFVGLALKGLGSKTPVDVPISNTEILNEEKVKLLGVNLQVTVNFDFHVNIILKVH